MPETGVKTPIGKVSKGSLFIGGLAAVAVAGYMYIKHKSAAATTATPAAGTGAYGYGAYGYGGMGGYGGYGYGGMGGYGSYGYGGMGGYGMGGYGGGGYPSPYGYGYYPGSQPPPIQPVTTNAEWAQAATSALTTQGYTGTSVIAALGEYLTGMTVSSANEQIVTAAIGLEGYPPQPGANGYPPAIHAAGTGGQKGYEAYAPGGKTLAQLAAINHVSWPALAAKNPNIARKYMGKPVPRGTGYYVPAAALAA